MQPIRTLHATLILTSITLLSACSAYIPLGSGALSGTVTPTPENWTSLNEVKIIQVETLPEDPYSVNLWVVGIGSALYIHSGNKRTKWVEHIQTNPNVRLKNSEKIYELKASQVTSADEYAKFSEVYAAKYGNPPRNDNIAEVYIYRLE